jgi:hypothetical protein
MILSFLVERQNKMGNMTIDFRIVVNQSTLLREIYSVFPKNEIQTDQKRAKKAKLNISFIR